jgi:hypothetical protein
MKRGKQLYYNSYKAYAKKVASWARQENIEAEKKAKEKADEARQG